MSSRQITPETKESREKAKAGLYKCSTCKLWKFASEFSLDRTRGRNRGLCYKCRDCESKLARVRHRKRKYNITKEDLSAMLFGQDGLCAICDSPLTESLHVDHNHETGKIRGLLCNQCNLALGQFKDSPEVLRKAAEYVERDGYRREQDVI